MTDDGNIITKNSLDETLLKNSIDDFKTLASKMLLGIQKSKKVFEIESVTDKLERLRISKLKADTSLKIDVTARIYDFRLTKEADLGFSIKSLLGAKSTLFNTGAGNNFRYRIEDYQKIQRRNFFEYLKYKYSRKKNCINRGTRGGRFKFQNIKCAQLSMNLIMIYGDLPAILQYALYYRFKLGKTRVDTITAILEKNDPMNFYRELPNMQKLYVYKMKRFLMEAAMGMTSEKIWMGEYDAFGGVLLAKKDGELVCFHIYDINVLRDYLFDNTFFEQPSSGEDDDNL